MTTEEITQLLLKSGRAGYVQNQGASIWVDDAAEIIADELERRHKETLVQLQKAIDSIDE